MSGIRVEPDEGPPETFLPGGSRLTDAELPEELLMEAVRRLRVSNKLQPARAKSVAITEIETAILWLMGLAEGKVR